MKSSDIACRRCGSCCLTHFTAYVTDEDLARWRREDRADILALIEHGRLIWAGDHLISADNGHYARTCPYLCASGGLWYCSIYETRPAVCRSYQPGSSSLCPQGNIPAP